MPSTNDATHYPLKRDFQASARLNLQHQAWLLTTGHSLDPAIELPPSALIADIGCGTGIWSLSLSQNLPPGCRIEASDISLAQAPPQPWWPTNVAFRTLDVFEDTLPDELVGRYDVIHIRLFVFVIASGNPIPLLKNLMTLLKPGGWLQWQEYDNNEVRTLVAQPGQEAIALQAVLDDFKALQSQVTTNANWVSDFHEKVETADVGAELVVHERSWTAKEALMIWQDCSFLGQREWCDALRQRGGEMVRIAERLEAMIVEAERECLESGRGVLIDGKYVTWVIRKQK
ncbi:UMTA methyltransferase family protein [Zymoseptoria brevis]|uniref:UMTA methyltransferase family protein n=1 Tax=Zymoseptoria brevis TaxID=1047168 RepID=A0A0F4GDI0_9PEZI|nr:UMTA methyltransferase family protein [Zymoseptoria brevis]